MDSPEYPHLRIFQPDAGDAAPPPADPEPEAPAPEAPEPSAEAPEPYAQERLPRRPSGRRSRASGSTPAPSSSPTWSPPPGLLAPDRIAQVRSRAASTRGSFAQALLHEGLASGGGVARLLASRHQLPFIDLSFTGIDQAAAKLLPLHVLERGPALPYALRDDVLYVAIADPTNVHAIDELRLATRYAVEFGIAAREEIAEHLKKLGRESEALGLRARDDIDLVVEGDELTVEDDESDLDADDGISEAPLVRLVNSIIFQAAEDGASDIHFEPQEDALIVRFRVDGVLQEIQRIPKRL